MQDIRGDREGNRYLVYIAETGSVWIYDVFGVVRVVMVEIVF